MRNLSIDKNTFKYIIRDMNRASVFRPANGYALWYDSTMRICKHAFDEQVYHETDDSYETLIINDRRMKKYCGANHSYKNTGQRCWKAQKKNKQWK